MVRKTSVCLLILLMITGTFIDKSHAWNIVQIDELIVMIPDAESGRNDKTITIALSSIAGVEVVGYCNSQKCFYLHVDRSLQPTNDNIFTAIRGLGYGMDLKLEGTIQEAQANCADRNE